MKLCDKLRKIRDEEELCDLYRSPNVVGIVRIRWVGYVCRMVGKKEYMEYVGGETSR